MPSEAKWIVMGGEQGDTLAVDVELSAARVAFRIARGGIETGGNASPFLCIKCHAIIRGNNLYASAVFEKIELRVATIAPVYAVGASGYRKPFREVMTFSILYR